MRRIATISILAGLASGLPLIEASANEAWRRCGRAQHCYAAPYNGWALWRSYYGAQAELSFARRAFRANYYIARGYNPPSRYLGPPTNYYAERYSLDPYSYFSCPLAQRGDGVCVSQPPLSVVPNGG
jgi:hypothetical protein